VQRLRERGTRKAEREARGARRESAGRSALRGAKPCGVPFAARARGHSARWLCRRCDMNSSMNSRNVVRLRGKSHLRHLRLDNGLNVAGATCRFGEHRLANSLSFSCRICDMNHSACNPFSVVRHRAMTLPGRRSRSRPRPPAVSTHTLSARPRAPLPRFPPAPRARANSARSALAPALSLNETERAPAASAIRAAARQPPASALTRLWRSGSRRRACARFRGGGRDWRRAGRRRRS